MRLDPVILDKEDTIQDLLNILWEKTLRKDKISLLRI